MIEALEFSDEEGRGWTARILWGHPVPGELGIVALRFEPADGSGRARLGFLERERFAAAELEALREALAEADPADAIG
jgi:hypothetical protein